MKERQERQERQERRENVILLLRSWLDYFPYPETWTGRLQRCSTSPGPAPFRTIRCASCDGTGRRRGGWLCSDCQGRSVYAIDVYTGESVSDDETPMREILAKLGAGFCPICAGQGVRARTRAERAQGVVGLQRCDLCGGGGRVSRNIGGKSDLTGGARRSWQQREDDPTFAALELTHARRDTDACYRDLHEAMRELRLLHPAGHFMVCWVYVLEQQSVSLLLPEMARLLDRALDFLLARMPERIRLPGEVLAARRARETQLRAAKGRRADRRAQGARNAEIRRLHVSEGYSVRMLAHEFGLSAGQVSRIINGGGA